VAPNAIGGKVKREATPVVGIIEQGKERRDFNQSALLQQALQRS